MIVNFLQETLDKLKSHGKTPEDVLWVMNDNYKMSWEEFKKIADFRYNNESGEIHIYLGIKVIGKDWWLERCESNGKEWWKYRTEGDIADFLKEGPIDLSILMY